jgi:acid phosphatase family membrane protein YuiD
MWLAAKEQLRTFFLHPTFLACLSSWLCAQFIKTVINLIYGKVKSIRELLELMFWRTGGLPSSHSALVTALCTTIGVRNGAGSDIFLVSLCFLMITVRDALGVRRSSGMQAKKLNELGRSLADKNLIEYKPIKEVNGHTPMEVMLGCVLGFFIGLSFSLLK